MKESIALIVINGKRTLMACDHLEDGMKDYVDFYITPTTPALEVWGMLSDNEYETSMRMLRQIQILNGSRADI